MDGHGFQLFKNERSFDHRILGQGFGDFAKPDLIGVRAKVDASVGRNNEPMLSGLGSEFPVFLDNLIDCTFARALNARAKKSLSIVAVVFDFDNAGIGARCTGLCRANPRVADCQLARCFLMRSSRRHESDDDAESRNRDFCHYFLPLDVYGPLRARPSDYARDRIVTSPYKSTINKQS